ncbi:MAG: RsmE family RNA methyltransferase [Verrucomicrobiota bacterium]|nr:RsmE family RNA methyltransferase [Verrucomicrobiota bacterium]
MHRAFHAAPELLPDQLLTLSPDESRHIGTTLRLTPGREIGIFNGLGWEGTAVLEAVERGRPCVARVIQVRQIPEPPFRITLAQVLPRTTRFDWLLQKATELGVHTVAPLLGDHSVARPKERPSKAERWEQILIAACKQSGNNRIPRLAPLQSVKTFLERLPPNEFTLIAALQEDALPLWAWIDRFQEQLPALPSSATLLVGPEGDFSAAESALARAAGCRPLALTATVLRSETAAIHAVSILQYELERRHALAAQ